MIYDFISSVYLNIRDIISINKIYRLESLSICSLDMLMTFYMRNLNMFFRFITAFILLKMVCLAFTVYFSGCKENPNIFLSVGANSLKCILCNSYLCISGITFLIQFPRIHTGNIYLMI